MTITAVVVTYNRRDLLEECLAALAAQTRRLDRILVVDNASSDGTPDLIRSAYPHVDLLALSENEGGAGGFHEGMKRAHSGGAEWLWLMDDDTIPHPDALERLLAAEERLPQRPAVLASKSVWNDGRMHPMNTPGPDRDRMDRVLMGVEAGLVAVNSATFVSLLVHRSAVDGHGLPHKHFFIWSDDIDYTTRVLRDRLGFLVPDSVVHHKTKTAHTAMSAAPDRFYFHVRNTLFMIRGRPNDLRNRIILLWVLVSSIVVYLRTNSVTRENASAIARGFLDGVKPLPSG